MDGKGLLGWRVPAGTVGGLGVSPGLRVYQMAGNPRGPILPRGQCKGRSHGSNTWIPAQIGMTTGMLPALHVV